MRALQTLLRRATRTVEAAAPPPAPIAVPVEAATEAPQGPRFRRDGEIYIDVNWRAAGVTAQFLENADVYHERYFNNGHWQYILGRLLTGVDRDQPLRILDIGSGSGNTVFVLAQLLPNATIVASDISPQLLQILMAVAEKGGVKDRIEAYCFDLHDDVFEADSFDLVVGGAILHHMLDPTAALRNVARWVKPGGMVALAEPMEIGAHLTSIVYHMVLTELEPTGPQAIVDFARAMINDNDARLGERVKSWTPELDDKWFFSPSRIRRIAADLDFSRWEILPFSDHHESMIENDFRGTLAVSGYWTEPLPEAVTAILREMDRAIAPTLKHKMQGNGLIRFFR